VRITRSASATSALRERVQTRLADFEGRWEKERALVDAIRALREQLEGHAEGNGGDADATALRTELTTKAAELEAMQGETPLVRVVVDASIVGEVISGWTGIPVGKMLRDELGTMLQLESHLGGRVIGQAHALEQLSRRIRTSKAGIEDPNKPKGVFMLVGPSGVGKTETAITLADLLYGGERNLITINMSEFQEAHTVSTLKGLPRATWATARGACSPKRCGAVRTAWCCSTKWRRRTPTCSSCSSRCSTRA
jgi:type VI secretion system protein VasG